MTIYEIIEKVEHDSAIQFYAISQNKYLVIENLLSGKGVALDKKEAQEFISELSDFVKTLED